jgi:hypothetical protein
MYAHLSFVYGRSYPPLRRKNDNMQTYNLIVK